MTTLNKQTVESDILNLLPATIDEVAGVICDGKQNLLNPHFFRPEQAGIIRKTGLFKDTSNGGAANIYEATGKAFTEVEKLKFYYSSDKHTCKVESVSKKEAEKIWKLMCDHSDDNTISHVCEVSNLKAKMEKGEFPPCAVLMFSKSGQLIKGHTYVEALARSVKVSKLNFVVQRGCEEDWGVY